MRVKLTAVKELLFSNRTLRQTAAKNAFWVTAGNVVGRLIKAGLIIYVARELGAAGYGVFSYAVGLAGFFSLFSDIGVSGILIREGARNPAALPEYLGTSLVIKVGLLVLTNLAIFFLAPSFLGNIPEALPLLPLAALLITADSLRDLAISVSRAQEKMQIEAGVSIVTNLAITILGIAAVILSATSISLMTGYALGSVVGTLAAFWVTREHFRRSWRFFRKDLILPILWKGLPFGLLGVLGTLMLNTDTLMIGWLSSAGSAAEVLGLYSAAQRPVFVLYIIPTILSITLFPAFSRLISTDSARFRSVLERAVAVSFMAAVPLVVGGILLRHELILLLFGSEYSGAATAFAVLMITLLTVFAGNIVSNAVFAADAQKTFMWYLGVGFIANAAFNYLLIPPLGIVGCAIGTIIAQLLANAIIWKKLRSLHGFRTLRHLPRILAAGLIMGAVVFLVNLAGLPVLVTTALGAAIYFGALYLLREPLLEYGLSALRLGSRAQEVVS